MNHPSATLCVDENEANGSLEKVALKVCLGTGASHSSLIGVSLTHTSNRVNAWPHSHQK